jgi:hypothetical protein
LDLIPSIR